MIYLLCVYAIIFELLGMGSMEQKDFDKNMEMVCPKCGNKIPVNEGYVNWCDKCGWNLKPEIEIWPRNIIERINIKLGNIYGKKLFDEMINEQEVKVKVTPAIIIAYILSILVHSLTLLFFVLAIIVIQSKGLLIFKLIFFVIALLLVYYLLPKPQKKPKNIIPKEKIPEIYKLIDELSEAMGGIKIDGIIISDEFNAWYTEMGIKKKRYICIGLPLFYMLDNNEKIAVLAHELAHGINRDISKMLVVYSAIYSLVGWYNIMNPDRILDQRIRRVNPMVIPINLVKLLIAKMIYGVLWIFERLLYNQFQRAEYLADYVGSCTCGTEAQLGLLNKCHMRNTFNNLVQKYAINNYKTNLFMDLQKVVQNIPEREIERLKRIERMNGTRIDADHPLTVYRMDFLSCHYNTNIKFNLSKDREEKIYSELNKFTKDNQDRLVDVYKAKLYGIY